MTQETCVFTYFWQVLQSIRNSNYVNMHVDVNYQIMLIYRQPKKKKIADHTTNFYLQKIFQLLRVKKKTVLHRCTQAQLHFRGDQQRAFGISNIAYYKRTLLLMY